MKIVAISDIYGKWNKVTIPKCDILISAGDYSFTGEPHMIKDFHAWLNKQDADHIISVQGNHETWVEKNFSLAKEIALKVCPTVHFIEEGLVEIEGLKIWCSAMTPWFHDWAYNRHRGPEIKRHWDLIPEDIDVLVTHGPPMGFGDVVYFADGITPKERVGCQDLMNKIMTLSKLKHHIFGHIHSGHGHYELYEKHFWNASICGERYTVDYEPLVIEI